MLVLFCFSYSGLSLPPLNTILPPPPSLPHAFSKTTPLPLLTATPARRAGQHLNTPRDNTLSGSLAARPPAEEWHTHHHHHHNNANTISVVGHSPTLFTILHNSSTCPAAAAESSAESRMVMDTTWRGLNVSGSRRCRSDREANNERMVPWKEGRR